MSREPPAWARLATRSAAVYASTVAYVVHRLHSHDLGSPFELALIGALIPSILGGAALGARVPMEIKPWEPRRAMAARFPMEHFAARLAPQLIGNAVTGGMAFIAFGAWSFWSKRTLLDVLEVHAVLIAVFACSVGIGCVWSLVVGVARLSVALAALTWAPLLTAFVWIPHALPPAQDTLNRALNLNPAIGILVALNKRGVFWNPLFYGKLPYAEYAINLRGPLYHVVVWTLCAAVMFGMNGLILRARWRSRCLPR